jgi:xanthine dehydrogenase YagS FAD-binding subunit
MQAFEYARPATVGQAVRLLAAGGSMPLAGGADLLALMKDNVEAPRRLVALGAIESLHGVRLDAAGLHVGALVTLEELASHPEVRRQYKVVAEAASHVAGPQIRNFGTVAGNLCQRPRCWYFRNGFGLLPERNGKSMVVEGDNRYHAIFGNAGPAYFVHPSTLAPLLIALGARLRLAGPGGGRDARGGGGGQGDPVEREIDLASFYRAPQRPGESEHALAAGELVTAVVVPPMGGRQAWSYEVRQRQTLDWSLATAAVALDLRSGRVEAARVVLGQVAPVPWRAVAAEQLLHGRSVDAKVAAAAGEAAVKGARPLSHNHYKVQLVRTAVKRALLAATGQKEV